MDQTLLGALARFEGMALDYGPAVLSGVSSLADALGGSEPPVPLQKASDTGTPVPADLASRLHRAADFLKGVLGEVERHTGRANVALGVPSPSQATASARFSG